MITSDFDSDTLCETKYSRMDKAKFVKAAFKKLKEYGLLKADHTPFKFLKAVFHKFYLVHS